MPRIGVTIKENITEAQLVKNLPKAVALGLTRTAKDGQKAVQRKLENKFTIRGPWWKPRNKFGIKMKPAEKVDNPIAAYVGTMADWLELHEDGGIKRPRGGRIAIPSKNVRRTKRQKIIKSERPRNLKRSFTAKTKKGNELIFKVTGRGKRRKVTPMFLLKNRAKIKKQSPVIDPVRHTVKFTLSRNITQSMKRVFRPKKPKKYRK